MIWNVSPLGKASGLCHAQRNGIDLRSLKPSFWDSLKHVINSVDGPWIGIGVLSSYVKQEGSTFAFSSSGGFGGLNGSKGLIDMGFM